MKVVNFVMFPRRSKFLRYVLILFSLLTIAYLTFCNFYLSGGWSKFFQELQMIGLNETQIKMEFYNLKTKVHSSLSSENKSVNEIYHYVQAMRKAIPLNPHDFDYIINPKSVCYNNEIFLLVYVHTAPDHYKRRTFIRETWGNSGNFRELNVKVIFLIGKPSNNMTQNAIFMESSLHGDLVQEDFVDSYRNLTYKAIMGLKWISNYCSNASFVLKVDDDIFVNIFNLISHLQKRHLLHKGNIEKFLTCLVWSRMKVVREKKSKWYISKSEFKEDYFPTYCSGSAFILSTDVINLMYKESFNTPFFWVDDFYITGMLANKLGIIHEKLNNVYILSPNSFLSKFTEENKWENLIFGHVHNINFADQVWKKIISCRNLTNFKS